MKNLDPRKSKIRTIESEGFVAGANGVELQPGHDEIQAKFAEASAEERRAAAQCIAQREAEAKTFRDRATEALQRWEHQKKLHEAAAPAVFLPAVLLVVAVLACGAEAFLLAPVMDMMGIADPIQQLMAAFGIVSIAAVVFHHYLEHRNSRELMWPALAIATVAGLTVLGVMRAKQLAFAASHSHNPLGAFLNSHPVLGGALFVFLTIFFPLSASVALHKGMERLHAWREYRSARIAAQRYPDWANRAEEALKSEKTRLDERLNALEEQSKQWKAAYEHSHQLGKSVGARRRPHWVLWAKSAAVGIVTFVVATIAGRVIQGAWTSFSLLLSTLLGGAAALGSGVYFHHQWEMPSPQQYLRQAALRFRDDRSLLQSPPAPAGTGAKIVEAQAMPPAPANGNGRGLPDFLREIN